MNQTIESEVLEFLRDLADKTNWCGLDESGYPVGIGFYNETYYGENHPMDRAAELLNKIQENQS